MGIREGFKVATRWIQAAAGVLLLAGVASWTAFCTTSWSYTDNKAVNYQGYGLWRICAQTGSCSLLDGTRNDWYVGLQACEIFGFMGINLAICLLVLYLFHETCKRNDEVRVSIIVACFVGAAGHLTAVIVFGALSPSLYATKGDDKLGFSFGIAVVASFFSLVAGILCVLDKVMPDDRAVTSTQP